MMGVLIKKRTDILPVAPMPKVKKPSPTEMESYCKEAVRAGMYATLLLNTVVTNAMALSQIVKEERHPTNSDIGDLFV
jgi:hypothetical protein